jgi:hypothetical protein
MAIAGPSAPRAVGTAPLTSGNIQAVRQRWRTATGSRFTATLSVKLAFTLLPRRTDRPSAHRLAEYSGEGGCACKAPGQAREMLLCATRVPLAIRGARSWQPAKVSCWSKPSKGDALAARRSRRWQDCAVPCPGRSVAQLGNAPGTCTPVGHRQISGVSFVKVPPRGRADRDDRGVRRGKRSRSMVI